MSITEQDKQQALKAFTNLLKDVNGRGPKNIHAKVVNDVIQFVIHGIVTEYERHLIKNFGDEALETFTSFYQRDSHYFEKVLNESLSEDAILKNRLKFIKLDSDFHKDVFVYHMKIECNQMHT